MTQTQTGASATLERTVTAADTAEALASGDLPVLATPRLLAWMEAATCAALAPTLPAGSSSVGTRVQIEHVGASPVGAVVRVQATVAYVDGRLVRFAVAAHDASTEKVLGHGEVTRVVVDRDRFLDRLG
ncbi:thioesterase family protein [Nocardioides mesophilus]|uniref:Thioesterase n=1 Tax=Nocardioides mesophilus TaxID=433659 RepID=A0A7G9R8K9_9ACTN|nr:hotdog domain-containing protein [Nocardioides mesophilus]QNN51934.1 thioesterase [Nocardioides mesophilus]